MEKTESWSSGFGISFSTNRRDQLSWSRLRMVGRVGIQAVSKRWIEACSA